MTKPKKKAPAKPREGFAAASARAVNRGVDAAKKKRAADPHAITKPGLYLDIPAHVYHADPCPTASGSATFLARIKESSPAHARLTHPRLNPNFVEKPPTAEMDFGSVAHTLLLDVGRYSVIDARNWQTDAAKEKRREVRSLHATPILRKDFERAEAMTKTLRADLAAKGSELPDVFDPALKGQSEVTAAWQEDGQWCRARLDRWIPPGRLAGAPHGLIVDYKTTGELATASKWEGKLYNMASDFQAVLYPHGVVMATNQGGGSLLKPPRFVFIVQEDEEPFAHSLFEIDDVGIEHTRGKIVDAWAQFVGAMKSGVWPKYPPVINRVLPPAWEVHAEARRHLAADVMHRGV